SRQRWLSGGALPLGMLLAFADAPASAQGRQPLDPVVVAPANPRSDATRPGNQARGTPKRGKRTARRVAPAAATVPVVNPEPPPTPLNGNLVATSASRLGLTVHEMPASVDVVIQQQMRE